MLNINMVKNAIISDCGKYRYQLSRVWDESKGLVLFIMHNPSTADADNDDPTIRRCINFAKSWGYGGIMVGNIIPYRCTNPNELIGIPHQERMMYDENMHHLHDMNDRCSIIVIAHGNPTLPFKYKFDFLNKEKHYLKLTKHGNPCHPLYLKLSVSVAYIQIFFLKFPLTR